MCCFSVVPLIENSDSWASYRFCLFLCTLPFECTLENGTVVITFIRQCAKLVWQSLIVPSYWQKKNVIKSDEKWILSIPIYENTVFVVLLVFSSLGQKKFLFLVTAANLNGGRVWILKGTHPRTIPARSLGVPLSKLCVTPPSTLDVKLKTSWAITDSWEPLVLKQKGPKPLFS
jgi:hypothetical protein